MKRALFSWLLIATTFALTACGGGGGNSGGRNTYIPPAGPTIANTSLSYYMPLAQGNSWTFASGGKLQDLGSMTLTCACPANGESIERIALYPPGSSAISGSFFMTKTAPAGNFGRLTNVVGVEGDANTNAIQVASDTTYPNGMPIMDDQPSVNEFWSDTGGTSTITSVGGTLMLPNNQEVNNIAVDQITGSFNPITWSFAKGVGFTQIGVGNQSTSITSFYVSTTASQSARRKQDVILPQAIARSVTSRLSVLTLLAKLFH